MRDDYAEIKWTVFGQVVLIVVFTLTVLFGFELGRIAERQKHQVIVSQELDRVEGAK
jgi:hypothetical protein